MTRVADAQSWSLAAQGAVGLIVGVVAGAIFFTLLWRNAQLFAQGRAGRAILTQVVRLCLLALVLTELAGAGAVALLSALAGVTLAREAVIRRMGLFR